jgi:hypothetical protein
MPFRKHVALAKAADLCRLQSISHWTLFFSWFGVHVAGRPAHEPAFLESLLRE